ncbi:MAG: 3',5'-cyclic-nucleotide phosphodiesterase [Planctomycetota bacterium]|nr:3',5'-cyclic-nucleotide phosphodiesterase [Planctomycetota bacterium]MDA1214835.1 3',5'-cyclic-nucleotide phosphodiesterase [Planctomycetota bacterium]
MKVKIVGVSNTGTPTLQSLISYVIDGALAIDAGCLGCVAPLSAQRAIRHVLLTHAHQDHIATLPIFLENVHRRGEKPVTVYGSRHTLSLLRNSVFNGRIWPNLEKLSIDGEPFVRFETIRPLESFSINGYRITAVKLNHTIPTLGYIVEETRGRRQTSAVAIVSDTGPTKEIWRQLKSIRNLKAVFLECSFPDDTIELAKLTRHLTPTLFRRQIENLSPSVRVLAVHLKPAFREQITEEFSAMKFPNAEIGKLETTYNF